MNFMTMQNSGLHRSTLIKIIISVAGCCVFLPVLLVSIWWFGAIPLHSIAMYNFEKSFVALGQPDDTASIQRYTYFGADTDSGNTDSGCYFYVAEALTTSRSLDEVASYYDASKQRAPFLADSVVTVLPVSQELPFTDDFFITGTIEELLNSGHKGAYVVYVRKIDPNMFGDFRCWIL